MNVTILGRGKKVILKRRHVRIHKRISGTPGRPRLTVAHSNRHMVAQVVNDIKGITLVPASAFQADFVGFEGIKTEATKRVDELIAEKAKTAGITVVVFDHDGNKYTGRVAAVADGTREGGLTL